MRFCDAHLHIVQCNRPFSAQNAIDKASLLGICLDDKKIQYSACSCAHDPREFKRQQELMEEYGVTASPSVRPVLIPSYGIHPQAVRLEGMPSVEENASFLQSLLEENKIAAIGEAGFDLFTDEFRAQKEIQEETWQIECSLAAKYNKPIVIHNRKALDEMFRDSTALKKIPAVVFHSFAFGPREAMSLLEHGINAFFSFGKPLLNGNKKSIACVRELPLDRLLLETDAPYQTLKGENKTEPEEIVRVYAEAMALRNMGMDELLCVVEKNFSEVFEKEWSAVTAHRACPLPPQG